MILKKAKHFIDKATTLNGRANARVTQFLRYTATASSTFALDLFLLWTLTEYFGVYYLLSAVVSFSIAISVNYITCRQYAFIRSERGVIDGYVRFVFIALGGIVIVALSMKTLVDFFGIPYLAARIFIGLFVGMWNYTLNAFWNFRK